MKKLVLPFIILVLIIGGIWYFKKNTTPIGPDSLVYSNYRNSNIGLSFTYPKVLSASTTANTVTLHHQVPFEHQDFCDFKGDATTTLPTLTDFSVEFHLIDKNVVDAMKTESPYIPQENFVNGEVIPSPGFIDAYQIGNLKGYQLFEGFEGCGQTIYYFSISNKKTLVVVDDFITIFSGAIDVNEEVRAMETEGVISKRRHDDIFESILKTVQVQ